MEASGAQPNPAEDRRQAKTSKDQLTLPKPVADQFPGTEYFDVQVERGRIVLRPARDGQLAQFRRRLRSPGP